MQPATDLEGHNVHCCRPGVCNRCPSNVLRLSDRSDRPTHASCPFLSLMIIRMAREHRDGVHQADVGTANCAAVAALSGVSRVVAVFSKLHFGRSPQAGPVGHIWLHQEVRQFRVPSSNPHHQTHSTRRCSGSHPSQALAARGESPRCTESGGAPGRQSRRPRASAPAVA
jgi:hypothetical protein